MALAVPARRVRTGSPAVMAETAEAADLATVVLLESAVVKKTLAVSPSA